MGPGQTVRFPAARWGINSVISVAKQTRTAAILADPLATRWACLAEATGIATAECESAALAPLTTAERLLNSPITSSALHYSVSRALIRRRWTRSSGATRTISPVFGSRYRTWRNRIGPV